MRYNEIVNLVLREFPALAPGYERMVNRHKAINEAPDAHIVYGNLFCDYLIEVGKQGGPGVPELRRMANWIETLATSNDAEVRYLAEVSILERLADEHADFIIPFLGPDSAKLVRNISERLNLDAETWGRL